MQKCLSRSKPALLEGWSHRDGSPRARQYLARTLACTVRKWCGQPAGQARCAVTACHMPADSSTPTNSYRFKPTMGVQIYSPHVLTSIHEKRQCGAVQRKDSGRIRFQVLSGDCILLRPGMYSCTTQRGKPAKQACTAACLPVGVRMQRLVRLP
jgi:hypothetical protein